MPIRDFLLDDDGRLVVRNGGFATVGGATDEENIAAVRQAIRVRVQMFAGEVWHDESVGVPWLTQILVKGPDPIVVRELLRQAIAEVPDVTSVVAAEVQLNTATRAGSISFTVRTVYGSITDEVTV